jgi:hypothetical protein
LSIRCCKVACLIGGRQRVTSAHMAMHGGAEIEQQIQKNEMWAVAWIAGIAWKHCALPDVVMFASFHSVYASPPTPVL